MKNQHIMHNQTKEMDQRRYNKLKGLVYSTSSRRPFPETVMAVAEWHLDQSLKYEELANEIRRLDREKPVLTRGTLHHMQKRRKVG